jgi:rhodanese-related sulfurtransferase
MKKSFLLLCLAFISIVFADSEIGCSISVLLHSPKSSLLKKVDEHNCSEDTNEEIAVLLTKTAITNKLMSVTVLHESEKVVIEREMLERERACPPFCIEPMMIKDVVTLGELETLAFIDKLKEKKSRLLIDVRENIFYEKATIPGAINLPFSMLKDDSKYQESVLRLLGATLSTPKFKQKWVFKNAQFLLLFGSSVTSSEASSSVKQLLKLGYPSARLFYYRGGIASWQALGLTTY